MTEPLVVRARDIDPKKNPAFSPNLHRFLRKHGDMNRIFRDPRPEFGRMVTFVGTRRGSGPKQIDRWVSGARLGQVLGGCYAVGCYIQSHDFVEVFDFWPRYLEIGRCVTDARHILDYDGRFVARGKTRRICQWCGAEMKRVRRVRREVIEYWTLEASQRTETADSATAQPGQEP